MYCKLKYYKYLIKMYFVMIKIDICRNKFLILVEMNLNIVMNLLIYLEFYNFFMYMVNR